MLVRMIATIFLRTFTPTRARTHTHLSLSLSLYIYIYIYICTCTCDWFRRRVDVLDSYVYMSWILDA